MISDSRYAGEIDAQPRAQPDSPVRDFLLGQIGGGGPVSLVPLGVKEPVSRYSLTTHLEVERLVIDATLVRRMLADQFPRWAGLPVRPVVTAGWDNMNFHLGDHMIVRLPSAAAYSVQVEKEHHWLPRLAPSLPLPIPTPLAMGEAVSGYPWR